MMHPMDDKVKTRIEAGIIGFGRFGRLLAGILSVDHQILVYDPVEPDLTDYPFIRKGSMPMVAAQKNLFFAVPILGFEEALQAAIPYLRKDALILDVLSVKVFAYEVMKRLLPKGVGILPTHPMFGPDSIGEGLSDLPFVLCPTPETPPDSLCYWRGYLGNKGFRVVEMDCEEHDRITASSLCLTQLLGRLLDRLAIDSSPIDTKNFQALLRLRESTCHDSPGLFTGLQLFNPFALQMRKRVREELAALEKELAEQADRLNPAAR